MKTVAYHKYQRHNPTRRVDWRWQRAEQLVVDGLNAVASRDDEPTCRAARYLRELARCQTPRQQDNLARRSPDIAEAKRIHAEGGLKRLEIEARTLAGQTAAETGRRAGVDVHAIETYCDLFFDVAERMNALVYIVIAAIRKPHPEEEPDADHEITRSLAHHGGPVVLEAVLDFVNGRKPPAEDEDAVRLRKKIGLFFALSKRFREWDASTQASDAAEQPTDATVEEQQEVLRKLADIVPLFASVEMEKGDLQDGSYELEDVEADQVVVAG